MGCAALQVPDDTLAQLLQRYSEEAKLEGTYFFCRQDNVLQLAMLLERVANLSLEDRSAQKPSLASSISALRGFRLLSSAPMLISMSQLIGRQVPVKRTSTLMQ